MPTLPQNVVESVHNLLSNPAKTDPKKQTVSSSLRFDWSKYHDFSRREVCTM